MDLQFGPFLGIDAGLPENGSKGTDDDFTMFRHGCGTCYRVFGFGKFDVATLLAHFMEARGQKFSADLTIGKRSKQRLSRFRTGLVSERLKRLAV